MTILNNRHHWTFYASRCPYSTFFLQGNWQSPTMASTYGTVLSTSTADGKSSCLIRFTTIMGEQVTFQSPSELVP
ncbi:MAG: hypothetical protein ACRCWR_03590 [Saezia sp.]